MKGHNRDILNYYHLDVRFSAMAKEHSSPYWSALKNLGIATCKVRHQGNSSHKMTLTSYQNFRYSVEIYVSDVARFQTKTIKYKQGLSSSKMQQKYPMQPLCYYC